MADEIVGEGWRWIDASVEFPYGHANGLRKLTGTTQDLTEEERAAREALRNEYDDLESEYAEADDLPEEVDQRLAEIEAALEAFENRPVSFDPGEIARAGVFLGIDRDGELVVDRGYVRPEDEPEAAVESNGYETGGAASIDHVNADVDSSGKSALAQAHPMNFGAAGVDGSAAANALCESADLVIGVGTRFQDFTTGSRTLFGAPGRKLVSINVQPYDAGKHGASGLVADARVALEKLSAGLGDHKAAAFDAETRAAWLARVDAHCAAPVDAPAGYLPTDAQIIGAVQRASTEKSIAMCAAGTMPGALKLLWQPSQGGYHMEYGYSCMGYEVAGALGIKLALPEREVICFVGDGSYMMANAELATAVMRRVPFTVVLTDNRGYGCINRLQINCGGEEFNNMYKDCNIAEQPEIDFVAHAASMGAHAEKAADIADLEARIVAARGRDRPTVIVIDTDAMHGPGEAGGGYWWDVTVPEVGRSEKLASARTRYVDNQARQGLVN